MEFELSIPVEKFRSTNAEWNNLMLNNPWSVGFVTTLIEIENFEKKEDWEAFYYKSGENRNQLLKSLSTELSSTLQNESLIRTNKHQVDQLSWNNKNINTQNGRTKDDFVKKGTILFEAVKNNGLNLTLEECIECVRYRVICETWNGVIVREKNTIQTLEANFPKYEFRKVSGEIDFKYAVDFEVYKSNILIFAIQIKPPSYNWSAQYIQKARSANDYKNREYTKLTGVPVFNIISRSNGVIENTKDLDYIISLKL